MNGHSLNREISYLTTLVSLIWERQSWTEEDLNASNESKNYTGSGLECPEKNSTEDDEVVQPVDETEFEIEIPSANPDATLSFLKRNALDRLAEVLARFKTDQKLQKKAGPKNNDAKHVASTTMREDNASGRVIIFCSKNNGIDTADQKFLASLKKELEAISKDRVLGLLS
ncbi:hypothetical protein N7495_002862 [Penicillium taxi]|uniref:uncharacterized protein n=1 Tax=Penicillium taxi TaxID=168475 RepID=UPI0025452645|nr:uncharacterized protein N7495_002862 [Penicillium taxi]KAJ5902334.1 hypothetical protein N7495_002862 [Penicillium taxi]